MTLHRTLVGHSNGMRLVVFWADCLCGWWSGLVNDRPAAKACAADHVASRVKR